MLGDKTHEIVKDTLIFILPGEWHQVVDCPECPIHLYTISFELDHFPELTRLPVLFGTLNSLDSQHRIFKTKESPYLTATAEVFRKIMYEEMRGELESSLQQRISLLDLITRVYRTVNDFKKGDGTLHAKESHQKIVQVIHYINENYYLPLSLEEMLPISGVGKRQFIRLFQQLSGTTFTKYINQIRIQAAKNEFSSGNGDILKVCFDVGYEDLSYFYRIFKQNAGKTPKQYLQEHRTG